MTDLVLVPTRTRCLLADCHNLLTPSRPDQWLCSQSCQAEWITHHLELSVTAWHKQVLAAFEALRPAFASLADEIASSR